MKLSDLIKLHIVKRLPAVFAAVLITALFSLYYIGFFDVSFIERPEEWKDNLNLFSEIFSEKKESIPQGDTSDSLELSPTPDTNTPDSDTKDPERPQGNSTPSTYVPLTFKTVAELKAEGYSLTDKVYDDSCVFAKLTPEYDWPEEFSYTWKSYYKEKVTTYDDGTESTVETLKASSERPALELYMGYIIYDNSGELFLIGPDGAVLTKYSDTDYIPAYTRDLEGRPLFYKNTTYTEKYPTVLGEENEDGEREWEKTADIKISDKIYYYLGNDGKTFYRSDYNDATDNRGLYFDYPSYYGKTSSKLSRYYLNSTKFYTDLEGNTSVFDAVRWTYSREKLDFSLFNFDKDGVLITDDETEEQKTKKDLFPYTMAYNYSEQYATVFMDIDWTYDHDWENDGKDEIETFDVTTNELRVINEDGEIMFESKKNFFSDFSWTAHERFAKPLLSGIDSLGSYYFDHGLMRLRILSWDCFYFAEYDTVKVVTDEDVLVRPNGERFSLPTGYDLVTYSDGIILLEKDGKYGYMNYLGNWIRDPELMDGKPFLEGVAVCQNSEGYYGVINTEGETLIPFNYKYISNISGGTLAAYSDSSGWTVYQKLTK